MLRVQRLLLAATLGLLCNSAAFATCSTATLKGTWGFTYEGFNSQAPAYCAGVGMMTFSSVINGADVIKITVQRESCDGKATVSGGATGSYTVSSVCTGKSTNLKYAAGTGTLDFNVVEAGQRLQFVLVVNSITLHGEALKR